MAETRSKFPAKQEFYWQEKRGRTRCASKDNISVSAARHRLSAAEKQGSVNWTDGETVLQLSQSIAIIIKGLPLKDGRRTTDIISRTGVNERSDLLRILG